MGKIRLWEDPELQEALSLLKDARERAGLSREELAERWGLSVKTIYRWERGRTIPSNRHYKRLVIEFAALQYPNGRE